MSPSGSTRRAPFPAGGMPVTTVGGVAKRYDDNVADAGRNLLVATGAAVRLVGGEGLDPSNLGRPSGQRIDNEGALRGPPLG